MYLMTVGYISMVIVCTGPHAVWMPTFAIIAKTLVRMSLLDASVKKTHMVSYVCVIY